MNNNFTSSFILNTCILLLVLSTFALRAQEYVARPTSIITGNFLGETPPLRDLPVISETQWQKMVEKTEQKILNPKIVTRSYPFAETAMPKGPDPAWQREMGMTQGSHAPLGNFNGSESPALPSDANGSIGPEYYMQTINSFYTIFNRAGTIVAGPTALNTLFYGVAGSNNNDGDPIILYDEQAHRWLVAEFSIFDPNDSMLIAVSTTDDPTGTWYKYSFDVAETPDYEKFGIWRDGYYMGTNNPAGTDIYVFERSQMLSGLTAQMVGFDNPYRPTTFDGFIVVPPIDNDGDFAVEGEPGLFIAFNDDAIGGGNDQLWIYELDVDWAVPASSTFSRTQQINVTSFDSNFGDNQSNINQLNTTQKLDAVPQVVMNPPQYRNFGTYETILCCHNVDVDGTNHAGIRWYELRRVSSGNWTVRQTGTYAPDTHSRWMGSIMLNSSGEIGLGYSISSSTLYPGIRYCGQSATAYASGSGTMDITEQIIMSGDTCQTNSPRWGDYSAMQIDPTDDETFWFTSQYIDFVGPILTGSLKRKTKIASFQVGTPIFRANFAASTAYPQKYSTVTFSDVSSGSPTAWNWVITPSGYNFAGGTSATSQDPQVQFTVAGDYTVSLTVTNTGNSDSETKTNFIHVSDCENLYLPFNEDFTDQVLPPCWNNIDNVGNGQAWVFNNPYGLVIKTPTGSSGIAVMDSFHYGPSYSQNADLVTPLLDLSAYTSVNLYFQYFFPYYTPDPDGAYGRLYYSIDGGASWINPTNWVWYFSANATEFSEDVSAKVAGKSSVRFMWNYKGHGYYWAIDDLSITGTGPHVWTGTTSTNWALGSNWSTGTVPSATSNVIIPATATNWPVYSGNFTVGSQCDTIFMYGSSQLTISGDLSINAGKMIEMKGDGQIFITGSWNNNGYFVPGSGAVHFTGSGTSSVNPVTNTIGNYIRSTFRKGMTEISGGTLGPESNDAALNVNIGFTFNYMGNDYNQARICTNGWISLTISTLTSSLNPRLFTNQTPNLTIAPWWDDLTDDATSIISYVTQGSAPNRVFITEWKSVPTYNGLTNPSRISFQVKLFETSNIIEFHYGELVYGTHSNSESASIGIENASGGPGNYIDATTGLSSDGISTLKSTLNWPTVNYRFYPPSTRQTFHHLYAEKTSANVNLLVNTIVRGNLTISTGTLSGLTTGLLEVKGNWINNSSYTPGNGTVIFNGLANQNVGGTSATTFNNLTINNTSGISFQNNENVNGTLTMISGNVDAGAYTLTLGTSAAATGTFAYTSGNITGSFKRWIAASTITPIDFPVGTASSNHKARITFSDNTGGALTVKFEPGDPGNNTGFPLSEDGQTINESDLYTEGSWTLVPATLSSSSFALELTGTGFSTAGPMDESVRILNRIDGQNWTLKGTHVAGSAPVAKRKLLYSFSRFALSKPNLLKKISGTVTYYNSANTLLNSGITIKLFRDGSQVGSDFVVTNGTYEFNNLTTGNYELRASSSNTTEGSINTTDAAQVSYWGVNPYQVEKVRFYTGDVTGSSYYINSTDALLIQNHFVYGTSLDKGLWAFWKTGETISSNSSPTESYPQVDISTSNITANIYGLCAGDFNRSFIPGALRSEGFTLELIYSGNRWAGSNEEFELPLRLLDDYEIGAISLILKFPPELIEIIGLALAQPGGQLDWAVKGDELRIGWYSQNPVNLAANSVLLNLCLKTKENFRDVKNIRITLADGGLSELADGAYEVIDHAKIGLEMICSGVAGISETYVAEEISMSCYPNPFSESTMIGYELPLQGKVMLEVSNISGIKVAVLVDETQPPGTYKVKFNTGHLPSGIYLATLKLIESDNQLQKTIKLIIKNH